MKSFKKAVLLRRSSDLSNISPTPVENEQDEDGFFDTAEMLLHVDAHDEGGLAFSNKQLLDSQRGAILEIAKEAGKKLLMGSFNLINLSMPVKMSEPRSYLQKLTDVWVYPRLLQKAADAEDPVERLKWVATWFTAGLQHVFQSWKKPFNPILGETWQAVQAGGSQIALEQISHHPAISAFQMIGPGGNYTFCGHSQPDVQFKSNAIKTLAKGYRSLHFRSGDHNIDIVYPTYYMRGILYSAMPRGDMDGTVLFTDPSRLLCCELQFGEIPGSEDPLLRRSDTMEGVIYSLPADWKKGDVVPTVLASTRSSKGFFSRLSDSGSSRGNNSDTPVVLASCTGNWLSHLDWDESRYWTLVEEQPQLWQSVADPLPSDSRFRLDLATLLDNDLLGAQAAKEALEQRQRQEAKLRKEGAAASNY